MLDAGIIEPSKSSWASNLVICKKRDGLRCCLDLRSINLVSKRDAYPIPRVDTCLDSMNGSVWFSVCDLRSAYFNVEIAPEDREKTAFICHRGLFQMKRMSMGTINSAATFQRLMDAVLNGLAYQVCLAYLDDVIIFSRDLESH
jgi:hypothetical protein